MENDITALNNILFECIERINDDELSEDELERELKKGKAIGETAKIILASAELSLRAKIHFDEYGIEAKAPIDVLGIE